MARRLEAGDWVVAQGAAGVASPGLGKLSGGDYDDQTGLLIRARVELSAGVRWFSVGDLSRVHPHVEAALLRFALDQELVSAPALTPLEARLADYREGRGSYVRSPGLLDALWQELASGSDPGLARLFEASVTSLADQVPGFELAPQPGGAPAPARAPIAPWVAEEEGAEEDSWEAPGELELGAESEDEELSEFEDWRLGLRFGYWPGVGRAVVSETWGSGDESGPWLPEAWEDEPEELWNDRPDLAEVAEGVAIALLNFPWTAGHMEWAIRVALGVRGAWLGKLVSRLRDRFEEAPSVAAIERFLCQDAGFRWHFQRARLRIEVAFLLPDAPRAPVPEFPVPSLERHQELADWLQIGATDLAWLADGRGWLWQEPAGPLQHYHYHWLPKRTGGRRLVEAPKDLMKRVQRQLLRGILNHVPPHEAAHGFRQGRSIMSYAAPHARQALVLRMDLEDFFPSVGAGRVFAIFSALGYSGPIARALTQLSTTRTPDRFLQGSGLDVVAEERLRRRHLPQGAPTSPALANLAAFWLDVRLSAAASAVGATYTRYADDLAFSGGDGFRRKATGFRKLVARIVAKEGFRIRARKTRWMRPHSRQRLAGLVVNERPRPSRATFDLLKATLYNCVRSGPASQNRSAHPEFRAHLRGRVAWFLQSDPARGARLQALFEQIDWSR